MRVGKRSDRDNYAHGYELSRGNPALDRICTGNIELRTSVLLAEINNDFTRWAGSIDDPQFMDMVLTVKRDLSTLKHHAAKRREAMKDE